MDIALLELETFLKAVQNSIIANMGFFRHTHKMDSSGVKNSHINLAASYLFENVLSIF